MFEDSLTINIDNCNTHRNLDQCFAVTIIKCWSLHIKGYVYLIHTAYTMNNEQHFYPVGDGTTPLSYPNNVPKYNRKLRCQVANLKYLLLVL